MEPIRLRMTLDTGWSEGPPGPGRLRYCAPVAARAKTVCIAKSDLSGADISYVLPFLVPGSMILTERPGAEGDNFVQAMVTGQPIDKGAHYSIPCAVRASSGSLAGADGVYVTLTPEALPDVQADTPAAPSVPAPAPADGELVRLRAELRELKATNATYEMALARMLTDDTPVDG